MSRAEKEIILDVVERRWKVWKWRIIVLIPAFTGVCTLASNAFISIIGVYNTGRELPAIVKHEPYVMARLVTDSTDISALKDAVTYVTTGKPR